MMCARCAELEEEVAYLKSELGLRRLPTDIDRLRRHFGLANGDAELLHALYAAKGRVVTRMQCMDATSSRPDREDDDRDLKMIDVRICRIRKPLGKDAILNVWSTGYRLSPEGIARVGAAINPNQQPQGGV